MTRCDVGLETSDARCFLIDTPPARPFLVAEFLSHFPIAVRVTEYRQKPFDYDEDDCQCSSWYRILSKSIDQMLQLRGSPNIPDNRTIVCACYGRIVE